MTSVPWFHVFVMANVLQFAFGLVITAISYAAYRSSGREPVFLSSTLGFLLITVGGVIAPVYELGIKGDYLITGNELLALQIIEGTVIAIGLALLVVSVYRQSLTSVRVRTEYEPRRADLGSEND